MGLDLLSLTDDARNQDTLLLTTNSQGNLIAVSSFHQNDKVSDFKLRSTMSTVVKYMRHDDVEHNTNLYNMPQ